MKNIAIIGGGFTGLTAAYRLSQKGHKVTIFERNSDLGGLAGGFEIQGANLEKTYHHIFRTDTDIIELAKELGIGEKLQWLESSISLYYQDQLYPFMSPMDLIKFKPLSLIDRARAGLVVLYLQKTNNWEQFKKISAYDWMMKWAGKGVCKVIWEPLLKGKFDQYYNKVSMAWLWARLHIRANSREKGESKEKLGYFDGGFNIITMALVAKLKEKGVSIFTESDVQKITQSVDGKNIVQTTTGSQEFDEIIATIPSHIFAKLIETTPNIPTDYIQKLNSITYLGAACMIFTSSQDLSKYYWHNINDQASPFLVFINHTKLVNKEKYNGRNVYYIASYVPHDHPYFQITPEELESKWFAFAKKMFPDFDAKLIEDKFLFRLKNAQHIVDLDYEAKIPAFKTPINGVYLSNFSQIYPEDRGTNYAVRDGNRIAEMVTE